MTQTEALEKAIKLAGGQAALATLINRRQSTIWSWLKRDRKVPPDAAILIENALDKRVTRSQLVFGEAA